MCIKKRFKDIAIVGVRKKRNIIFQVELHDERIAFYVIQFAGNGHYFKTIEETEKYLYERFKITVNCKKLIKERWECNMIFPLI